MSDTNKEVGTNVATNDSLEEAIQYAKKYLEDVISFFGLH